MNGKNYALMLGNNTYICDKYRIFYEIDSEAGKYKPYLILENTSNGLVLTADIYLEYENLVATVDRNNVSVLNDNYYWSGEIEKGEGLKLIERDSHQVKFNVFITDKGDACITGTLVMEKMRLYLAQDFILVDNIVEKSTEDEPHAEGNFIHNMTYRGHGDFIVRYDGFSITGHNLPI